MTDLNIHITPAHQKAIGSLTISDQAVEEMGVILREHGHPEFAPVDKFGPVVASAVSSFLVSIYFTRSRWFRAQLVHRTTTIEITGENGIIPIFHLQKHVRPRGYEVIACTEAPLSESYYEDRVIEEVKVETNIPA